MAKYQVPYMHGNLQHYPQPHYYYPEGIGNRMHSRAPEWRDPEEFVATLKLVGMERGMSAKYLWWVDVVTDAQYPMFIADLVQLVQKHPVSPEGTDAVWIETKRGRNFGVKFVRSIDG